MFLALGVGAWSAGIFHLMTHAFFKALLFLAAGAVIHCLHHEHNIFKMGGLGSNLGVLLWLGGLLGAILTAIYSFRLVFIVFFGEAKTEPDKQPGWRMAGPLALLCVLSIIGGWFALPLATVFPVTAGHSVNHLIEGISIAIPIIGVAIAWLIYYKNSISIASFTESGGGQKLMNFWHGGWGIDTFYNTLLVKPYNAISHAMRGEWLDKIYHAVVALCVGLHLLFSRSQSGKMRTYATGMAFGLIILVSILMLPILGWAK